MVAADNSSATGKPFGTCEDYPDDVDTTSYALKTLHTSPEVAQCVMDDMVSPEMTTADGIVKVGGLPRLGLRLRIVSSAL